MRIEHVVVDASPLIVLFKSGLAGLLPGLFSEVIVPLPVRREVEAHGKVDAASTGLANAGWATIVDDLPIPPLNAAWDLGAGESSVLAHAMRQHGRWAILDDRAARTCARALRVRTRGSRLDWLGQAARPDRVCSGCADESDRCRVLVVGGCGAGSTHRVR